MLGVLAWALLPRSLGPVTLESATLLAPGDPGGDPETPGPAVPTRIALTYTAATDLEAARRRLDMDYVAAELLDCRHADADSLEPVAQTGALPDFHRTVRLAPAPDGRPRYRTVFDAQLAEIVDHQARFTPALTTPGGLCFRLYAARMWFGYARSPTLPVRVAGRGARP